MSRPARARRLALPPLLATVAACVATVFAIYGFALRNSWCCDDTQILQHALRFSPAQYFFDPSAWRALIPYSLTPWLSLTYDLDHALAGFNPRAYYAHHLMVIGLAAALIGRLAALWVGPWFGAAGALLFLLGAPIAQASQLLMVRHYTEGLFFYLLALLLCAQRLRGGPAFLLLGSGLAYAVAASAKEIFLPLGLLALLLPIGTWAQRLRAALPFGIVMLLYVPWRGHMLGDLIGGYSPPGEGPSMLQPTLTQLAGLPGLLWHWPLLGGAAWLATVALALVRLRQRGLALGGPLAGLFVLLALLLLPLLPLVRFPGLVAGNERYLIGLWAALSLVFAVALGTALRAGQATPRWPARLLAGLLFAAVALPAALCAQAVLHITATLHREHRALVEAMASEPAGTVLMQHSGVPEWFVSALVALQPAMGRPAPPPRVMADDIELAARPAAAGRVLRYDSRSQAMQDIGAELPARMAAWRAQLRAQPMSLLIERDAARQHLRWQFGAPQAGRYSLLAPGQRIDVPAASGALRMEQALPPCFRIRFDALDGGISYSPALSLPPADAQGRQRLQWQGIGELPLGTAPGSAAGAAPVTEASTALVTAPGTTPAACLPLPGAAAS